MGGSSLSNRRFWGQKGKDGNEKGRELILRLGWFVLNSYSFILNDLILFHLSQICTSAGQANSVNCTEWVVRDLNPISLTNDNQI